jgi:hypothetical protein
VERERERWPTILQGNSNLKENKNLKFAKNEKLTPLAIVFY